MELIDRDDLDEVLRHELGHVATLFGEPDDKNLIWPPPQHDWAAEGVAEYIAWAGQPRAAYPRLDDIRTYVRADRWNGSLPVNIDKADRLSASATYGLNYLVIRYLADRYGEPAMLRLIDDLLRNHKTADNATRASLGQPWATIATDLTTHLRNIAS